jgi:integrase
VAERFGGARGPAKKPPRVFPFAQAGTLDALLHRQRAIADQLEKDRGVAVPWVFHRNGRRIKDCRSAWKQACTAAGLEGRLMHDLRRSAVRNLVNAGVPELTAMKLTGHKTHAVFDRYKIVSPSETAGAVAKLASYLEAQQEECHKTATIEAAKRGEPKAEELRKER